MIVSHTRKFIFVKTRKTASTSLEIELSRLCDGDDIVTAIVEDDDNQRPWLKVKPRNPNLDTVNGGKVRFRNHAPLAIVFDAFGERVLDYTIISCERNPFDRVISAYFWEARDKTDAERQTMLEDRDQFREFLFGSRPSLHGSAALYSLNGFNVADYIVRQEHLAEDLATVAKALDAEGELNFDTWTKSTFRPDASRDKATQKALFEGLEDVVFDKYARTFSALEYGALGTDCGPFEPLEHRQQIKRQYVERLTK